MKNKLQLMFCFGALAVTGLLFFSANGQGIGDRNRPAGRGTYRIVGRVLSPTGAPAQGVLVTLSGMEMSSGGSSARSDQDGNFEFSGLSSGNYTVSAHAEGYPAETESLTIAEGAAMSGQGFNVVLYLRLPGQKKGDVYYANPLFKDVPKGAMDKFKKGVEKLQANDSKAAIAFFSAAIAEYPNFAAASYDLGMAYLKEADLDKALAAFVQAIAVKSDYTEAKYYVGYTQFQKKNYEVAAAVFDDVLKQKEMPEAHLYLGMALTELRYGDAAIPHLKAATAKKDDETMALAHRFLGAIYIQKKQNAEAAAELQRYLDLVPNAADADKLRSTIASLRKGS